MLLGIILFLPFLGSVHLFDWDEINFAEAAREMLMSGNYLQVQIDYRPFWEKPPLFIWMQAASMQVFGINEFAARFPNALCGIITLIILFRAGKSAYNSTFGFLWCLAYAGSFLPHFYFRSGIIDPWFNLFIFLGIWNAMQSAQKQEFKKIILAGIFTGLAMLTKGPVALLISGLTLCIAGLRKNDIKHLIIRQIPVFVLCSVLTASLWFGIEILNNGTWFIQEFIRYQIRLLTTGDAGHSGPFYYHVIILLIGCFPASVFALPELFSRRRKEADTIQYDMPLRWMKVLFWIVLILFSIVKTKIVHYSSLAYFPLTFLAAYTALHYVDGKKIWNWKMTAGTGILILFWSLALLAIPLAGIYSAQLIPLIRDRFARENLMAPVYWSGAEIGIGILYLILAMAGLIAISRQKIQKGIVLLYTATLPAIWLFLPIIAPRIEGYTQRMPIEFYESCRGKDVYVYTYDFKSYAHLFYTAKGPATAPGNGRFPIENGMEWLLSGAIDKTVYLVAKTKDADELFANPALKVYKSAYGFTIFQRSKP